MPALSFPLGILPSLPSLTVRVAGCPFQVSLPLACWYTIPRGLCVPRARCGCPSSPGRVLVVCVFSRAPAAFPGSNPGLCGARFWGRMLVGPFQVVRAPLRFLHRSCAPPSLFGGGGGGGARSLHPLALLWIARPLVGGPVRPGGVRHLGVWGGGAICLPPPPWGVVGSGSVGGSRRAGGGGLLCLSPSLCLPRTGTNAGCVGVALSMEGVVSILLRFVFARSRLGAVCRVILCTGL